MAQLLRKVKTKLSNHIIKKKYDYQRQIHLLIHFSNFLNTHSKI
jgi:hypothetical protein